MWPARIDDALMVIATDMALAALRDHLRREMTLQSPRWGLSKALLRRSLVGWGFEMPRDQTNDLHSEIQRARYPER
jgi:hypothetical protein